MKSTPVILVSLGVLAGVMAVTNPKPDAYTDFAAKTMTTAMQDGVCQREALDEWLGKLGGGLGETCEVLIGSGAGLQQTALKDIIASNTQVKNYGLFTTYTTTTPLVDDITAVGVFNRFILL
ncbi:MAG: DUF4359 domain-containing protein [Cyanobacteria bacterium J06632_22]